MSLQRRIGYYELWSVDRLCDSFEPESIKAGALTHINIAFALIDLNFHITDTNRDLVARVSNLKRIHPALRVNIAIGNWKLGFRGL
jgi:GH18 family chitinase